MIFWTAGQRAIVVRGAIIAAWRSSAARRLARRAHPASRPPTVTRSRRSSVVARSPSIQANQHLHHQAAVVAGQLACPRGACRDGPQDPRCTGADGKPGNSSTWHWWWLLVIIPGLLLIGVLALGLLCCNAVAPPPRRTTTTSRTPSTTTTIAGLVIPKSRGTRPIPTAAVPRFRVPPVSTGRPRGLGAQTMPGPDDVFDGDQDSIDTTPTRIPVEPEADTAADDVHPEYVEYARSRRRPTRSATPAGTRRSISKSHSRCGAWTWAVSAPRVVVAPPRSHDESRSSPTRNVTVEPAEEQQSDTHDEHDPARPAIHLPLADPYQGARRLRDQGQHPTPVCTTRRSPSSTSTPFPRCGSPARTGPGQRIPQGRIAARSPSDLGG